VLLLGWCHLVYRRKFLLDKSIIYFTLKMRTRLWEKKTDLFRMPQASEPVGRCPVRGRHTPTKFERIFSYLVILIVVLLGVLVVVGTFGISPRFKGILGVILIGYGLIRFLLMRARFDRYKGTKQERLGEGGKEGGKSLRR
jgi:hypothetical protein